MTTFVIPSNTQDQRIIADAVKEASDSLMRQEAETQLRRDIAANMKDQFKMPSKDFNRMVKVYHTQALAKLQREQDEFAEMYESIMKNFDPQLKEQN